MVAESMMKAGERYADLAMEGAQQLIDRYIHRERIYCLNRSKQFGQFLTSRVNTASPFKVIIANGPRDGLVESFQKRITELTLNLPKKSIYKNSLNGIFGSCLDYESCKQTFLNAAFQQLFDSLQKPVAIGSIADFTRYLNEQASDCRVAFVIQWSNLVGGATDPRIPALKKLLAEFHEACLATECSRVLFFINIEYKPENEPLFVKVINEISSQNPAAAPYIFPLEKLSTVMGEDLEIWIENYVTDVPYKVNSIIEKYLPGLDDEFTMQAAEEKMDKFIMKVNARDKDAIELLK
jgi:hypothetical protein